LYNLNFIIAKYFLGEGADPNKPQCRKAKEIRKERKLQKLKEKGKDVQVVLDVNATSLQSKYRIHLFNRLVVRRYS